MRPSTRSGGPAHRMSKNSSAVKSDEGENWASYFSNVDGGCTVIVDWNYNSDTRAWFDTNGDEVIGCDAILSTIYLSNIIKPAILAIEAEGRPS